MLLDGQIISGQITPRPDGYDVQVAAGRIFINSDECDLPPAACLTPTTACETRLPEFTPTNHLELARWCLDNKLHYSGSSRSAGCTAIWTLIAMTRNGCCESLEHVGADIDAGKRTARVSPSILRYRKFNDQLIETRSLAGLSRSVAHSFVRDVQPLLMNKCATSGCHGSGDKVAVPDCFDASRVNSCHCRTQPCSRVEAD